MRITRMMKVGMLAGLAGMIVFSLGAPALASTGQPGPTPPTVGDVVASVNEVQVVTIKPDQTKGLPPIGGTFTLSFDGQTTEPIVYNATAEGRDFSTTCPPFVGSGGPVVACSTIEGALEQLSNITDVTVLGLRAQSYVVTFNNPGGPVAEMTGDGSGLVYDGTPPAAPIVAVTTRQTGEGAAASGRYDPHGGYGATTNFCLQCHAVHSFEDPTAPDGFRGGGEYALLLADNVVETCNTCHSLFSGGVAGAETGPVDSNLLLNTTGLNMGSASLRTAYDGGDGQFLNGGAEVNGHELGADTSPLPDDVEMTGVGWTYGGGASASWLHANEPAEAGTVADTAGVGNAAGGLYCGSCHTPHGEFGQAVNTNLYRSDANPLATTEVQVVNLYGLVPTNTWNLTYYPPLEGAKPGGGTYSGYGIDGAGAGITVGPFTFGTTTAANIQTALQAAGGRASAVSVGATSTTCVVGSTSNECTAFRIRFGSNAAGWVIKQMDASLLNTTNAAENAEAIVATTTNGGPAGGRNIYSGALNNGPRSFMEAAPVYVGSATDGSLTSVVYLHLDKDTDAAAGQQPAWTSCPTTSPKYNLARQGVLTAAITSSQSTFQVNETGAAAPTLPFAIQIGTEEMLVNNRAPVTGQANRYTYSVTRSINGTTAASALAGADVVPFVADSGGALDTNSAGSCSLLTTADAEGQTVYLYGYKLLSAFPNHQWTKAESYNLAYRGTDSTRWCGACHPSKVSSNLGDPNEFDVLVNGVETEFHSHPSACWYCHGNPADGSSSDFPHTTETGPLLKAYPDALCVGCHTTKSLP